MARKRQADQVEDEIILLRPTKLAKNKEPESKHITRYAAELKEKGAARHSKKPHTSSKDQPDAAAARTRRARRSNEEDPLPRLTTNGKQKQLKRSLESDDEVVTPKRQRQRQLVDTLPSPAETPSRGATKLLDKLQLHCALTPKKACLEVYQTPPATPRAIQEDYEDMLPKELVTLATLYTAVVSATSAQLATNVSAWRINVKQLLETATAVWRKRDIVLDDLRRVLLLAQQAGFKFSLENYGRAGIFMVSTESQDSIKQNNVLDSVQLRKDFEVVLRQQWQQSKDTSDGETFAASLPLCTILVSDSVQKAAPLFSRGKQRLEDLRSSQLSSTSNHPSHIVMKQREAGSITDRGASLLDRILTKQANFAALPTGPTQEELEKKSALYRVEDIARVLEVLSAGRARASFSMQSVVQQLQQSLRSPMSRVEVERCLAIMAEEIMPSFVSVVKSGTVSGIVVTRNGKLGIADLKKRLADAGI